MPSFYSYIMKKKSKTPREEMLSMIKKVSTKKPAGKKGWNPFVILLVAALILSVVGTLWGSRSREVINDTIGLNQVIAQYQSGSYTELIVE